MDYTPWLVGQGIDEYDLNNMSLDASKAIARAVAAVLGTTGPVVTEFAGTQTTSPSLSINISEGQIYQLSEILQQPIGTLPAITTLAVMQGYAAAQQINLNVDGLIDGQSVWWLVQAQYEQVPGVRSGDPTNGLRPFYNSSDITMPLSGPDGLGGLIDTVIAGNAVISAIAGTPATTGTNVPPAPSSGCVPLFLINLAHGQTAITNGEIMVAGPGAYTGTGWTSGYPYAPFLAGLLQSHHGGIPGQAPKINLASEVQGLLSYLNMLVSDQTPAAAGGDIVVQGIIPVFVFGNVAPNGNVAGKEQTIYANLTDGSVWYCTTTGDATHAVWVAMSSVIPMKWSPAAESGTFTLSAASGTFYVIDCTSGVATGTMPPNPGDGTVFRIAVKGSNDCNIGVGSGGSGTNQFVSPTGTTDTTLAAHEYAGVFDLVAMPGGWYVS